MPLFHGFSRQFGDLILRVFALCLGFAVPGVRAQDAALPPNLGWDFEIALGGSVATGNTDRQAMDLETKVRHRVENREDRFKLLSNLARENKDTTAERVQVSAQTNYDISKDKFYVLAFAQYDRDRFSGFRYEAEVGPGLGYRFVYTEKLTFSLEFSPGYRHGEFRVTGRSDDKFFARGTSTIEYKLSENARLANETLVTGDASRVKVEDTFSVTSTLIRSLAARISFNYRMNTNPPPGVQKTDTLSKVSLVYSF